jgi:hypothetical protein
VLKEEANLVAIFKSKFNEKEMRQKGICRK